MMHNARYPKDRQRTTPTIPLPSLMTYTAKEGDMGGWGGAKEKVITNGFHGEGYLDSGEGA